MVRAVALAGWLSVQLLNFVPSFATASRIPQSEGAKKESAIVFSVGGYVTQGSMSSKGGTLASRTLNSATGYILLGHQSGYLMPFLFADYGTSVQSTDALRVSGTNLSGNGYSAGAGLRGSLGSIFLAAGYLPFGTYALTAKTQTGLEVSYSNPTAWILFAGYEFESAAIFLVHKQSEFSDSTTGPISGSLGSDRLYHQMVGLGVEWAF